MDLAVVDVQPVEFEWKKIFQHFVPRRIFADLSLFGCRAFDEIHFRLRHVNLADDAMMKKSRPFDGQIHDGRDEERLFDFSVALEGVDEVDLMCATAD